MKSLKGILLALLTCLSIQSTAAPDDEAYFRQFLYRKENLSNDPDFPNYIHRFLMSDYNIKFRRSDGQYIRPLALLLLLDNGKFWLGYKEHVFKNPDDLVFFPGACKIIQGAWSVPDRQLYIENIAVGDRLLFRGQNAVSIVFSQNISSDGLAGLPLATSLGGSNVNPSEMQNFCF